MFKKAGEAASSFMTKTRFKAKLNSPEILMVAGLVSGAAAIVTAIKKTPKAEAIIEEHKEKMDKVHEALNNEEYKDEYSEQDAKKDTVIIYAQTAGKLVMNYAPTIILETISVGCILGSHNILKKRNLALAAAYAAVDKSFKEYRGRVVERFGDEVDHQLRNNIKVEKLETEETDENGKTKKKKKNIDVMDLDTKDIYVHVVDRRNVYWVDNEVGMMKHFDLMQHILNNQLNASRDGCLMLNDALEQLQIPKVYPAGQVVGWKKRGETKGDGYVQLKVHPIYYADSNGVLADAYAVEFNCDGYILDDIAPTKRRK